MATVTSGHMDLELGWLKVRVCGDRLHITVRDGDGSNTVNFIITRDCAKGICVCLFTLAGIHCQLKQCRFFVEVYLRGSTDMDAQYIIYGIVFAFRVMIRDFKGRYDSGNSKCMKRWELGFIQSKLISELDQGMISFVDLYQLLSIQCSSFPRMAALSLIVVSHAAYLYIAILTRLLQSLNILVLIM